MGDAIKSIEVYSPKFNKNIKGHAKIELRNPYKTQIVEHDNVVQTEVVEQYMRSLGSWGCNFYDGTWDPVWKRLFGGIFIFDSFIPVGSQYMPAGVVMTANGAAGTVNTTTPLAMGSWDSVKSGLTDSTCTMVYNWTQPQACGEIASVCLSSRVGGYIGYGNTDGAQKSTINIYDDQSVTKYQLPSEGEGDRSWGVVGNSIVKITLNNSSKVVTATIQPRVVDRCNVLSSSRTIELSYDTALESYNDYTAWMADGKGDFVTAGRKAVPVGDSFHILVLNMNSETLNEYSITNNSDTAWGNNTLNHTIGNIRGFDGDHIYVTNSSTADSNLYKIRITDSAVVQTIPHVNTVCQENNMNSIRPDIWPFTKNHKVAISDGKYCIWDSVNETMYPINLSTLLLDLENSAGGYRGFSCVGYHEGMDAFSSIPGRERYGGWCQAFNNPMYLATINNLDESIQKTNEDTMVVTYTLERSTT